MYETNVVNETLVRSKILHLQNNYCANTDIIVIRIILHASGSG